MNKDKFLQLIEKISVGSATDAELMLFNHLFNANQSEKAWNETTMGNQEKIGKLMYNAIDEAIKKHDKQ